MQFSNTPLLRGDRACSSLRELLGRLGTRQLADLVLGFSLQNLFTSTEPALQQAFRARWRSARERAAYCAVLAQRAGARRLLRGIGAAHRTVAGRRDARRPVAGYR